MPGKVGNEIFLKNKPVNNLVFVQVLQSEDNAGSVEDRPRLGEDVRVDVHHQVAAGGVLHHEAHVRLGLKMSSG